MYVLALTNVHGKVFYKEWNDCYLFASRKQTLRNNLQPFPLLL